MSNQCRSCGAEVVFVPSATSGKPMILDAKPAKGLVRVIGADGAMLASPGQSSPFGIKARVVDIYTDHHATCPNVGDWQGRTRKDGPVVREAEGAAPHA